MDGLRALWTVYAPWGWGTEDGDRALALLRRFGSVTVLNGHIHQVIQKVEGNTTFHTARGTAYPQPAPGVAAAPGPLTVPGDQLRSYLGITDVKTTQSDHPLALVDAALRACEFFPRRPCREVDSAEIGIIALPGGSR